MKKEFDKEYLTNVLGLPWYNENIISNKVIEVGRWDITHELVFKDLDGTLWETSYWHGATELQPEGPWEYEDVIECIQVEERVVPVTKFLPVCDSLDGEPQISKEERELMIKYLKSLSYEDVTDLFTIIIGDDLK